MRRRTISLWLFVGACTIDPLPESLEIGPPIGTRTSVVWPDQTHQELIVAVPDADDLAIRHVAVGDDRTRIGWLAPTRDRSTVMAMMVPATERIEDVDARLVLVDADGLGEPEALAVRAPFSSVSVGPDGRRVVLHFAGGPGTEVLQNANQVALVDLEGSSVRDLTLDGFGGRLAAVDFPTADGLPVQVGQVQRELIAFLAEGEMVLVDAASDDLDQVAIRFFPEVAFVPVATLVRPGNPLFTSSAMFVRSSVGTDVAMLTLVDHVDEQTGVLGFTAQVSLVPVGDGASDMLGYDSQSVPYLVTVLGGTLSFTDIRTQQGFTVELGGPATRLGRRVAMGTAGEVPQLIAWALGGTAIYQLDLDGIEDALGRRPERLTIETGIEQLVWLDNDRVLVGSGTALYVVDFSRSQVTPLTSAAPYDADSSALAGNRLLLATPGQSWVSVVDLLTLDPQSMVLDEPVDAFFHLPDAGRIAVVHDDGAGAITIADDAMPTRASSYTTWGVFYDSLLERR